MCILSTVTDIQEKKEGWCLLHDCCSQGFQNKAGGHLKSQIPHIKFIILLPLKQGSAFHDGGFFKLSVLNAVHVQIFFYHLGIMHYLIFISSGTK